MPNITTNSTAAYFTYVGGWSRENTSDSSSRIWQVGDSIDLSIQGTILYLFGNVLSEDPNNNISSPYKVLVSRGQSQDPLCTGNATSNSTEGVLCTISSLDFNQVTNLTLSLVELGEGSRLNLSRIEWIDPNASDQLKQSTTGSSASADSTNWTPQGESSCTWNNGSSITFNLEGAGVAVKGMATARNLSATYRVLVDGILHSAPGNSGLWKAYAPQNQIIDLYRNDRLGNANRTITLSDIQPGGQFCVLRADVFGSADPPSDAPLPSASSPSGTPTPMLALKHTSSDRVAGAVVGALVLACLLVGGALMLYRRRTKNWGTTLEAKKLRYCSKCGGAITDRYRMECVQAESCVQDVDLHVKCEDWNTPTNHSHSVHKITNN